MAQTIKQANIWGRVGTGIGKGLAEQVPKEIEHYQKVQGLNRFAEDYKNQDPMQNLIQASSIRGLSPQQQQSIGDLARQESQNRAWIDYENKSKTKDQTYQPTPEELNKFNNAAPEKERPSITSSTLSQDIQKGVNLPTNEEEYGMAAKAFSENPRRFKDDFNNALSYVKEGIAKEKANYEAKKGLLSDLQAIETNVRESLGKQAQALNVKLPSNIYSKIEDEAIESVQPKDPRYPNRKGLTAYQASKEMGEKLEKVSNQYQDLKNIGNVSIVNSNPESISRTLDNLRKDFEKRDDLKNMAETIVADTGVTFELGYAMSDPVKKYSPLNKELKSLPDLNRNIPTILKPFEYVGILRGPSNEEIDRATLDAAPKLAKLVKETGASPLSVAHVLEKKNYNPEIFMDYMNKHVEDLNLNAFQSQQLNKIRRKDIVPIKDFWFSAFTGVE